MKRVTKLSALPNRRACRRKQKQRPIPSIRCVLGKFGEWQGDSAAGGACREERIVEE